MATAQVNGITEPNEADNDSALKKAVKYDSGARDLEKVTDYAEEKEVISAEQFQGVKMLVQRLRVSIFSYDNDFTIRNCSQAMSIIGDRRNREAAEKRAKEIELMKVSIKKEDVDLIVSWYKLRNWLRVFNITYILEFYASAAAVSSWLQ